jgi:hypothetical protein
MRLLSICYFRKIKNAEPKGSVPATGAYLALLNPAFRLAKATLPSLKAQFRQQMHTLPF